jgi:hypothetical protein
MSIEYLYDIITRFALWITTHCRLVLRDHYINTGSKNWRRVREASEAADPLEFDAKLSDA